MNRRTALILTSMALLSLSFVLPASDASAQQKQKVSYKVPAENTKYTQQLTIPVGGRCTGPRNPDQRDSSHLPHKPAHDQRHTTERDMESKFH